MSAVDNAYHYYLSTYGSFTASRYDTHKKSELRHVYNSILKINREAPLYKLKQSEDVPRFLIDIKEHTRQIKNVISSLSDDTDGLESSFQKKVAVSSDEDIVSVAYIGSNSNSENSQQFNIEVKQLATPQVNLGNFLFGDSLDIPPGDYSFDLTTTTNSYEFQFTVNPDDTNRSIQDKLTRLFNTSGVGLTAEVMIDEKNRSSLKLTSKQTGLSENETSLFEIKPSASSGSITAMEVLGIEHVSAPAHNSSFILNGKEHSSYSNTFTINNIFELTLHGISQTDHPSAIGFKTSIDAVADNLQKLVDAYNGFIETGENYSSTAQGNRLLRDLKNVSYSYKDNLENIGMIVNESGSITIDKTLLADALDTEDPSAAFSILNSFKNSLFAKADNASINPIKYVDKIIIAYKRPGRNFTSPYYSSIYSGMMLDRYC